MSRSATPDVLILAAAPAEARAIAAALAITPPTDPARPATAALPGRRIDLAITGVGKVNAALAAVTHADPTRHGLILSLGLAGALPTPDFTPANRRFAAQTLDVVVATRAVYADEGVTTPNGYIDIAACGLPPGRQAENHTLFPGMGIDAPARLATAAADHLRAILTPVPVHTGPVATVSTCSGVDVAAIDIARRTGAIAEVMESAAIAHALLHAAPRVRHLDIRVISNVTGDRERQQWALQDALRRLSDVTRALFTDAALPWLD